MVVIPTLVVALYYMFFAAPMYVSEAKFIVRSANQNSPAMIDSVLMGVGLGSPGQTSTDAYVVHEYITSREAVNDLAKNHNLRTMLARSNIDQVARFPRPFESANFESLYRAYGRFVSVDFNSQTGISTLHVQAFTPADAAEIANALLDGGEGIVNRLNDRASADAVAESRRRMLEAEEQVTSAEAALTEFRNRERLIDPSRSSLSSLDLVGKLEGQLDTLRAQRSALGAAAPKSPQLAELDRQITAFQDQLDDERLKMAGQDTSFAPMIGEYERLSIERDFAAKELELASAADETARLDLRRKRLYLERIVGPNAPDAASLPHRTHAIGMTFLSCLLIYGIVVLVRAGLNEHNQA